LLAEVELVRLRQDAELERRQLQDIVMQNERLRNAAAFKLPETASEPSVCRSVLGLKRNEVRGFLNLMVEACRETIPSENQAGHLRLCLSTSCLPSALE
jgi:hypothetical protein